MNQQATQLSGAIKTPPYAWVILVTIYFATLAATLSLFKLPPVMTIMARTFDLSTAQTGDLMAIFSIMGFVLAIPAGFILKKFGIKLTGLVSVGFVLIGSTLGALMETSQMLFVGRFIEGAGMGLIMVAAPLTISLWFPMAKRALPTGLWASSVGIGNILALIVAPSMAAAHGWPVVWWSGAGFAAFAFILFAILFRMPRPDESLEAPAPPPAGGVAEQSPSLIKGMANINYWMIAIAFGCYNLVVIAMLSFLPYFLERERGYFLTFEKGLFLNASFVTALIMLASIFSGPAGGYLSDRIGKRKLIVAVSFVLITLTFLVPFTVTGWMIPAYMLVFGIVGGPIAPVLLASVPEVAKKPQLIGIGMSVAALCQNLGMYLGPAIFGRISEAQGWAAAGYWMIPVCLIGLIATLRIKVR
ncbi:MAG TPA: MFS transporter [Acidobacteriota bacterium]|nr:MFS transporter [Acidobacteriota bacterium]